MTALARAKATLWPWAGLMLGGAGLILAHQLGSDLNTDDCGANGADAVIPIVLLGLLLTGSGAWLSWRLWQRGEHESAPRRFIALVSMLAALLFSFAIILPLIASLIIPRCYG